MKNESVFRRTFGRLAIAGWLLLGAHALPVQSAPVCVDPEGAIGGTGGSARSGAIGGTGQVAGSIGGTGAPQGAIGGTGQVAGAIGGTGAPQGAIGGTGQVAAGSIGGTGAPEGSIGGTGQVAGAIGGTGSPEGATGGTGSKLNGGIGGTGVPVAKGIGGTGIVGTITGFASVCVNGLEVHFDESTPIDSDGRAAAAGNLAVGQVVAIDAEPSARGLRARRISVIHAVAGPVTAIDHASGRVKVMNQTVRIASTTRIAGADGALRADALRPGTLVEVSGQRDSRGEIVASRIEREENLPEHILIGRIGAVGRDAAGDVSGTPVEGMESGRVPGATVQVRGRWTGERLRASEIDADPVSRTVNRAEHVVLEGYVQAHDRDSIEVAGQSIGLSSGTRIQGDNDELAIDKRIVVSGRVDRDGRISAERIELEKGAARSVSIDSKGRSGQRDEDGSREDRGTSSGRDGDDEVRAERSGSDDRSGSGRDGESRSDERSATSGSDRSDRSGSSDRLDGSGSSDRADRSGSPDKADRVERADKIERADKVERVERAEKVERADKVERVERAEKVERVDKVEKVERVEVPSVEKIERPETTSGKYRK